MTKERLEELHKQGATIIRVTGQGLSKTISKFYLDPSREYYFDDYDLSIVYETEEHYKWQRKTYAERIERFEPPMWEDFKERYCFAFNVNFGKYTVCYTLDVDKRLDEDWAISIDRSGDIIHKGYATKENYEKACEIFRKLFKEEKCEKQ